MKCANISLSALLALAVAVTLTITTGASAAALSSSAAAHSSKNKSKGKGSTQAQIDAIWAYLYNTTSSFVDARVTIGGPAECVLNSPLGFDTICDQSSLQVPRTVYSTTRCPSGYAQVVQTDCWGWVWSDDGEGFIGPLPVYDSGAIGVTAYCRLGTEGLADGTVVQIYQTATCSSFYGALASGSTTAAGTAPRIFGALDQDRLAKAKGL